VEVLVEKEERQGAGVGVVGEEAEKQLKRLYYPLNLSFQLQCSLMPIRTSPQLPKESG
jgi:hypothetical protein